METFLKYAKAMVPLIAGLAICFVDKVLVDDEIPDGVWLALIGSSPVVAGVPNKEAPK